MCFCFFIQVNEYLKDVMAQEQKKKETQSAEQTGGPRVGVLFSVLLWQLSHFTDNTHFKHHKCDGKEKVS